MSAAVADWQARLRLRLWTRAVAVVAAARSRAGLRWQGIKKFSNIKIK